MLIYGFYFRAVHSFHVESVDQLDPYQETMCLHSLCTYLGICVKYSEQTPG